MQHFGIKILCELRDWRGRASKVGSRVVAGGIRESKERDFAQQTNSVKMSEKNTFYIDTNTELSRNFHFLEMKVTRVHYIKYY